MKILLTTHLFLPEHSAGTEILTFNTAKELQRQGHDVEVVTGFMAKPGLKDADRFDTYNYEGIRVNRFFHHNSPMGGQKNIVEAEYNNLFFGSWFRQHLTDFQPDIVHFFHLGLISASAIDVCREMNIPMTMTPTDFWLICPTYQLRLPDNSMCKGPDPDGVNCVKHAVLNTQPRIIKFCFNHLPKRMLAKMIHKINSGSFSGCWFSPLVNALCQRAGFLNQRMNMLDRLIVPTRLMEKTLVENGLNPGKISFRRYGMRPISPEPHTNDANGKLRIGFIGGLSEHKGSHVLIRAFHSLPADLSIELKIYGDSTTDPRYFKNLQQLAGNDQRIHFCGTFPNEIIGQIFAELDALVVPSIWYENTPLVIYSAQAASCPVIASNLGGMAEVVKHEINGLLFEAGNVAGLACAIERLVQDRALLRRLSENAEKPKSISEYVSELLVIYGEVLSGRGGEASTEVFCATSKI